jgi:hypothetical protein
MPIYEKWIKVVERIFRNLLVKENHHLCFVLECVDLGWLGTRALFSSFPSAPLTLSLSLSQSIAARAFAKLRLLSVRGVVLRRAPFHRLGQSIVAPLYFNQLLLLAGLVLLGLGLGVEDLQVLHEIPHANVKCSADQNKH